jgi:glycerophosphoryl diester phosphodiesterase
LSVWVYPINDRSAFDRALRIGFDALITSRPDLVRAWCEPRN